MPQCSECKYMQFMYSKRKDKVVRYCRVLLTRAEDPIACGKFEKYDPYDRHM